VPETPSTSPINLVEVTNRAEDARHTVASFAFSMPTLASLWRQTEDALSDIPVLATQITRLHDELTVVRIDRANLAAAARASIAAYHSDEPDPLSYLLDELLAQGFGTQRSGA
jgi:hypothetical protein